MEDSFKEIFKYLRMVQKRRYLCMVIALLVMSIIAAYSYRLPKQYQADSTVFIERSVINNLVKGIAVTPDMDDRIRVLKYALLSRDIIGKVLAELDVDTELDSNADLQAKVTELQKRTNLKIRGKDLFIVSITDKDPAFAQNYVNTLVSKYVEDNLSATREETYGANRFLDEQIVLFKHKLDQAEDAIIEFRKSQGILHSSSETTLLAEIKEFEKQIENISLTIETLNAKRHSLRRQLKGLDPTVTIFSEKQREDRVFQLQQRITHLLLTYTENYPEVIKLKVEMESLRSRIANQGEGDSSEIETTSINPLYQEITQKRLEVEAEISSLEARRKRLRELASERRKELQFVPENKKKLAVLIQERDSHRKIYEELLMRMGQSEVSKQMEIGDKTTTFRIVDPAIFPEKPVSPNMIKMLLMAIVGGVGCGVGLVILLDMLDGSVKDSGQLQDLGVEVLAVIPTITDQAHAKGQRIKDILVFTLGGIYFSGIVGLLAWEFLKKMA